MKHQPLPTLSDYQSLQGFRRIGPEVVVLTDAEWIECEDCGGAGFNYLSSGPDGATADCANCDGSGGWTADEPEEVWEHVADAPGYQVSSIGRILGPRGKICRGDVSPLGYTRVKIYRNGKFRRALVHRLVCEAFNGPPPQPGMHCDHINCDPRDMRPENLRWLTPKENRARVRLNRGSDHPTVKLTEEQVLEIRRGPHYRGFDVEKGRKFGVATCTVQAARTGRLWRHLSGANLDCHHCDGNGGWSDRLSALPSDGEGL